MLAESKMDGSSILLTSLATTSTTQIMKNKLGKKQGYENASSVG